MVVFAVADGVATAAAVAVVDVVVVVIVVVAAFFVDVAFAWRWLFVVWCLALPVGGERCERCLNSIQDMAYAPK